MNRSPMHVKLKDCSSNIWKAFSYFSPRRTICIFSLQNEDVGWGRWNDSSYSAAAMTCWGVYQVRRLGLQPCKRSRWVSAPTPTTTQGVGLVGHLICSRPFAQLEKSLQKKKVKFDLTSPREGLIIQIFHRPALSSAGWFKCSLGFLQTSLEEWMFWRKPLLASPTLSVLFLSLVGGIICLIKFKRQYFPLLIFHPHGTSQYIFLPYLWPPVCTHMRVVPPWQEDAFQINIQFQLQEWSDYPTLKSLVVLNCCHFEYLV